MPYFHWGPLYVQTVQQVMDGTWEPSWIWAGPDWDDINNPETTTVGFVYGDGLTDEEKATLDEFIAGLAAGAKGEEGGLNLYTGPLTNQDGSVYLEDGPVATEKDLVRGVERRRGDHARRGQSAAAFGGHRGHQPVSHKR